MHGLQDKRNIHWAIEFRFDWGWGCLGVFWFDAKLASHTDYRLATFATRQKAREAKKKIIAHPRQSRVVRVEITARVIRKPLSKETTT